MIARETAIRDGAFELRNKSGAALGTTFHRLK
jgi:hypothetical protein